MLVYQRVFSDCEKVANRKYKLLWHDALVELDIIQ
jgi:hypothetical protein